MENCAIHSESQQEFLFFWGHHEKPGKITKACLSQWYPCQFEVDGISYNCMEQFMMAEKARLMNDKETRLQILQSNDPQEIKALGREVRNFDAEKWDANKTEIVVKGNLSKFSQNEDLKSFLISTGDKVLVEASPYDKIWGIGLSADNPDAMNPEKWRGTNLLGISLMRVRAILIS